MNKSNHYSLRKKLPRTKKPEFTIKQEFAVKRLSNQHSNQSSPLPFNQFRRPAFIGVRLVIGETAAFDLSIMGMYRNQQRAGNGFRANSKES